MSNITDEFRNKLDDVGVKYTTGYAMQDGRRVSDDIATNVICKNGTVLSFEESDGVITLFDLSGEQAFMAAVFLS